MKYRLVASDFDDTLYPAKLKKVSDFTLNTVKRFIAAGGIFVIVTGRMFAAIIKQADKLGLEGYIISYQGALISDIRSRKTVKAFNMPHDLALEYIAFLKDYPVKALQVYMDDVLHIERRNQYTDFYCNYCDIEAVETGDMTEFIKNHPEKRIHKVYVAVSPEVTETLRTAAENKFGDRLLINKSTEFNVEAVVSSTSKGKALAFIAEKYGIDREEILAFGDQLNDLTLLEYAGTGVAVANGSELLKSKADAVCLSAEEDGVAKTILKLCLEEEYDD